MKDIFTISFQVTEEELHSIAEDVRPFTKRAMKIQVAPWLKGYNVDMEKLYTELTLEKIENEPTGPLEKRLEDYKELFVKTGTASKVNQTTSGNDESNSEKVPGEKILFKGDPGMGKTTISRKITWDWAVGLFKTFFIVFLVYLKFVRQGDSIENVIIEQTPVLKGLNVTQKRMKQILETFGNRILVILDGLDEHALGENRDVDAILKGRKYMFCNFLLTSRPHSISKVQEKFHTVVKVDGFTYNQAQKFVSNLLLRKSQNTKAFAVFSSNYVSWNKVATVMDFKPADVEWDVPLYKCPILLSFLCILSRESQIDLSSKTISVGEIYIRMVRCLYKKFTLRKEKDFENNEFFYVMKSLGKLAYETLLSGNPLLKRSDIIDKIGNDAFDIGLLIGHEDFRLIRDETANIYVTFPHRSIQEFLGAFYFVLMLNEEVAVEYFDNVQRKIHKNTHDSDVGSGRNLRSILSDHDNFILKNLLYFQFCLWFLCSGQTHLPFKNNEPAYCKLTKYIVDKIDVHQFDMQNIVDRFPVLDFQYIFKRKDKMTLRFLENILTNCQRIKHLIARRKFAVDWCLKSVGCDISSVTLTDITIDSFFPFPRHYAAPPTDDSDYLHCVVNEEPSLYEAIKFCKSSGKHPSIIFHDRDVLVDPRNLFNACVKELHMISQNNLFGRESGQVSSSYIQDCCQFLTHLSLIYMVIGVNTINVLSKAEEKLPVLSHLSFEDSLLPENSHILFKVKWLYLTHLNLDCHTEFIHLDSLLPGSDSPSSTQNSMSHLSSLVVSDDHLFRYFLSDHNTFSIKSLVVTTATSCHHAIKALNAGKWPDLEDLSMIHNKETYSDYSNEKDDIVDSLDYSYEESEFDNDPQEDYGQPQELLHIDFNQTENVPKIDQLNAQKIPGLKSFKMSGYISSTNDITDLKVKAEQWRLSKLDTSHSLGLTGNLSILLRHGFPSLNSLILSDCELNSQDLCSLAQATVEGRLPHLTNLDISENPDVPCHLDSLFSDSCSWNQLWSLKVRVSYTLGKDIDTSSRIDFLSQRVKAGCLRSLQELSFSVLQNNDFTLTTCWPCLQTVHLSLETDFSEDTDDWDYSEISPLFESLADAVDRGFLPQLHTIYLSYIKLRDNPIEIVHKLRQANICIYHRHEGFGKAYDLK